MTENQKNVEKHCVLADFGHLMEMLWIPLISQIGRNHQNMWKKSVFLKVPDNVWTCFEIKSWQESSKKTNKKNEENSKKNAFFLPCCSVPVIYLFLYLYICLQSPAVILSSDLPQPIGLLSANLFICVYIYTYMHVFIFIFIYLPAITCGHFKSRPSPTYWPTVCLPICLCVYIQLYTYMHTFIFRFIYLPAITFSHVKFRPSPTYWPTVCPPIYLCVNIHICMYLFLYLYIYLQSPAAILSWDPPQPIDLLSAYLFIYVYIYMYVFFLNIYILTCNHLQSF